MNLLSKELLEYIVYIMASILIHNFAAESMAESYIVFLLVSCIISLCYNHIQDTFINLLFNLLAMLI